MAYHQGHGFQRRSHTILRHQANPSRAASRDTTPPPAGTDHTPVRERRILPNVAGRGSVPLPSRIGTGEGRTQQSPESGMNPKNRLGSARPILRPPAPRMPLVSNKDRSRVTRKGSDSLTAPGDAQPSLVLKYPCKTAPKVQYQGKVPDTNLSTRKASDDT